jgi:hypothetical protein
MQSWKTTMDKDHQHIESNWMYYLLAMQMRTYCRTFVTCHLLHYISKLKFSSSYSRRIPRTMHFACEANAVAHDLSIMYARVNAELWLFIMIMITAIVYVLLEMTNWCVPNFNKTCEGSRFIIRQLLFGMRQTVSCILTDHVWKWGLVNNLWQQFGLKCTLYQIYQQSLPPDGVNSATWYLTCERRELPVLIERYSCQNAFFDQRLICVHENRWK